MKNYIELPKDEVPKYFGVLVKDKDFYKRFFSLLIVISLQQLAALMVNMVDNIMLGTYSELALSGATLVNQIQFVLQRLSSGLGMGIVVLASQYWGQKRIDPIKKIISLGLKFAFAAGLIFFVVAFTVPHGLLSLFTTDESIILSGMEYLRIICWTYIIFCITQCLMYSLQSVETVMIGTVMSVNTIFVNMCLNYCLIFGHFGLPELGIRGAAIATLVSRILELVIILGYMLFMDKKLKIKLSQLLSLDFTYFKDYTRVATPLIVTGFMWGIAQATQTAILGHIGAVAIAANSIAVAIYQVFSVFGLCCGNVASVVIGKTIGSGRLDLIRAYTKTIQFIFVSMGLLMGALIFIFKDPIVSIYNVTDETKELALAFLTVLSISVVGTCYEYSAEKGIIAGGGMTKYPAVIDNLFMWLFTIPVSFLSAFVFKWPPIVTFCCLKADQLIKCIPNGITCNRYRWVRILTK